MHAVIPALGLALLAFAWVGVAYTVAAGLAVGWLLRQPSSSLESFPPVTVLKPLHGDEPGLRACLEGFCTQDYPAPIQIVFGVREAGDAAVPLVEALGREHPEIDIELVADGRAYGSNRKISNLINMQARIRHPVVVLADSDVSVRPDYLRRLASALAAPGVGYVTCAYVGVPVASLWSRLSAMAIDHHFLPSVAFGMRWRLAVPCFGPTIALRKAVLDQVGGFQPFADHLADDFELGRAIRRLGHGFAVPSLIVGHGCPERSLPELIGHELRWARTIRLIDPVSYAGSAVCHPLPWALLAVVLLHGSIASLATLAAVAAARMFVIVRVELGARGRARLPPLWPVRDLLSIGVWAAAYMIRSVSWRGRRFQIGRDGVLIPFPDRPRSRTRQGAGIETAAEGPL